MSYLDLLAKITSGQADPQAVLFYGSDSAQLNAVARELSSFWIGVEEERLPRCVDFQRFEPQGLGKQITVKTIHRTKNQGGDEEEVPWIPVVDFFRTLPLIGKRKAVWFSEAERMNGPASNAFLKTLEELQPHARVVLTTTQFSRILPTIRSRCLCVACGADNWEEIALNSDMERFWARNEGELAAIRAHEVLFAEFWDQLDQLPHVPMSGAILISERATKKAAEFAKATGIGTREAQVYFLDLIGRWWLRKYPEYPSITAECSAIAREILGYSNGQLGFDTLFGMMLAYIREPAGSTRR